MIGGGSTPARSIYPLLMLKVAILGPYDLCAYYVGPRHKQHKQLEMFALFPAEKESALRGVRTRFAVFAGTCA